MDSLKIDPKVEAETANFWRFHNPNLKRGTTDLLPDFSSVILRATLPNAFYLAIDTFSPIFLRGDTNMMPSIFVSYYGKSLNEKTPLLRANDAITQIIDYEDILDSDVTYWKNLYYVMTNGNKRGYFSDNNFTTSMMTISDTYSNKMASAFEIIMRDGNKLYADINILEGEKFGSTTNDVTVPNSVLYPRYHYDFDYFHNKSDIREITKFLRKDNFQFYPTASPLFQKSAIYYYNHFLCDKNANHFLEI